LVVVPSRPERGPVDVAEAFGRVVAAVGLVVTLPLLVLVAVLVVLDSAGSPFFTQTRVGRDGRTFRLWKFRTMVNDAESVRSSLEHLNEVDGPLFKLRSDPRTTRVGRWLRRLSIDELPQLWNVIRGDMALVGPRPPLPSEVARYDAFARRRLLVKPGLTGLWQVSGRSTLSWSESVRLDVEYVERRSLRLDLDILRRTVAAVLTARGAY
jgi:lipopolysaccharide/colanic/teichoic acid biosynthesis glycosyltransferase